MARGWESKSVEEQIDAAESRKQPSRKHAMSPDEIERIRRRDGLLLERTRIVREMERANKRRHLTLLERTLAHIDRQLAEIE